MFHKTPLFIAAGKCNREIIGLLLKKHKIDISIKSILNY